MAPSGAEVLLDPRTASRRPHRNRKLTMLIPATSENVALPHCSDECAVNLQKTARGADGVAKFCTFVLDFDEFWGCIT
jgi:hypothetical protein